MKMQIERLIIICTLSAVFGLQNVHAQIQQNNIRVVDTVYTPPGYAGGALTAKLWLPSITNGAAIVLSHASGSTISTMEIWGNYYSSYGYVVIAIDYYGFFHPSGIPSVYPDPVRAYKTAIEFLRRNAMTFGCYTGKVAGFGFSQGAWHWPQAAAWDNDDAFFGTDPLINDHPDAMVLFYGLYDYYNYKESIFNTPGTTDAIDELINGFFLPNPPYRETKGNPFTNIDNITTPALIFHGTSDQIVNYMQSVEYNDSLLAHGKSSKLILFAGADHGFDNHTSNDPLHNQNNQFTADGTVARDTALAFLSMTLGVNNIHCPYNKSHWKNHSSEWNTDAIPMKLGTANYYSKQQLLAIFNSSAGNDPSLKLAQELIATKLNLANNSYAPPIVSSITSADNLIGNRAIPIVPAIASNSSQGNQMTSIGNTLKAYNNGTLTPNCNNGGNRIVQSESSVNNHLEIFPNPVANSVTIKFSLNEEGEILITNLFGQKVFSEKINSEQLQIDVSKFSAGMYLVKWQSGENFETKIFSVVKQN